MEGKVEHFGMHWCTMLIDMAAAARAHRHGAGVPPLRALSPACPQVAQQMLERRTVGIIVVPGAEITDMPFAELRCPAVGRVQHRVIDFERGTGRRDPHSARA